MDLARSGDFDQDGDFVIYNSKEYYVDVIEGVVKPIIKHPINQSKNHLSEETKMKKTIGTLVLLCTPPVGWIILAIIWLTNKK